jgi:integrase
MGTARTRQPKPNPQRLYHTLSEKTLEKLSREGDDRAKAALTWLPRISDFVFAKPNGNPYHAIRGFRAACQRAGLTGVTPHSTRHTFTTRLCENGVDLRLVQELGGWATLALVQRYAHVSPGRKAEAVEGLVRNSPTLFTTPEIRRIGNTA